MPSIESAGLHVECTSLESPTKKGGVSPIGSFTTKGGSPITEDHVAGPKIPDRGAAVGSRFWRTIVFTVLCQAVQMFMSYDSGATSASLDTIREAKPGYWTTIDLSLLGAMDKIGTTLAAVVWGRLLQLFPTKCLLGVALGCNAACTLLFGVVSEKYSMYATKFAMGATQALQNIWGSVWTVTMAPPDCVTTWMAFGGISAAVGTGLGSATAGFGTANGLPYSFAFILQACLLGVFWVFQLLTPARLLAMHLPDEKPSDEESPLSSASKGASEPSSTASTLSMSEQLVALWRNKIYVWTLVATCLNQFQVQAIQYFFILIFGGAWGLDKNYTTSMTIVVPGIGLGLGIAFGPAYIDRKGGFTSPPAMKRTLTILRYVCIVIAIGSIAGIGTVYGKLRSIDKLEVQLHGLAPGAAPGANAGDAWLHGAWVSIIVVMAGHSFCVAALSGINTETVPPHMRSFASGIETAFRNLFGYFAGTILPGAFIDLIATHEGWDVTMSDQSAGEAQRNMTNLYCLGLAFIFSFGLPCFFVMHMAVGASGQKLVEAQKGALIRLQEGFAAVGKAVDAQTVLHKEAVTRLMHARDYAKSVELERTRDGEMVMGMINELIGELNVVGPKRLKQRVSRSKMLCPGIDSSKEELIKIIDRLERELDDLRPENERLAARVKQLEEFTDSSALAARVKELEEQVSLLRPYADADVRIAQAEATDTGKRMEI